ncbi:hypothetical protein SEA_MRMIYAGI_88 [Mycobacterium phage MrMiyagi]|uniref:Uncharacterized protein n=1 Tax=Mycobacterium phage MrMiyagi TaxID=2762395 RepID=A0A7G8LPX9_9CAUD|nr:hypothetical protein SEA_MRMIYAGI_88 [Mycobacterium phage MrMiyagi]
MIDKPGVTLIVTKDNPLFKQILTAIGNLEEKDGQLIFTKPIGIPRVPRAKMTIQIEDGEPVTYVFDHNDGASLSTDYGLMIESHWETSDAIHRRI